MSVWSTGAMVYDDHQWALIMFLKGSMIVFVVCAALIYTKFRFRMIAYVGYLAYWWLNTLPETGQFLFMDSLASNAPLQNTFRIHWTYH